MWKNLQTYVTKAISGIGNSCVDLGISDRSATQTSIGFCRENEVGGGMVGVGKSLVPLFPKRVGIESLGRKVRTAPSPTSCPTVAWCEFFMMAYGLVSKLALRAYF